MIAILAAVCLLVVKIVLAALDKVMKIILTFAEKNDLDAQPQGRSYIQNDEVNDEDE